MWMGIMMYLSHSSVNIHILLKHPGPHDLNQSSPTEALPTKKAARNDEIVCRKQILNWPFQDVTLLPWNWSITENAPWITQSYTILIGK